MGHSTIDFLNAIKSGLCNVGVEIDDPVIKQQIQALDEAILAVQNMKKVKELMNDTEEVFDSLNKYEYAGAYTDGKIAAYGYILDNLHKILWEKQ